MPDSRDVFSLRKEGKPREALELARQVFAQTPSDSWTIKAYGWSLHDCLKLAQDAHDAAELRSLYQEFSRIEIPAEDDILLGARENWKARIPPEGGGQSLADMLKQAKDASGKGNRQEALNICRNAVKKFPDAPQARLSLGWEIQRALGDLVGQEDVDGQAVRRLLQEYGRLQHIEKPGNLHSLILLRAAQAAQKGKFSTFIGFLRWWDTSNLQPDDFERFTPDDADRSFDSRVEHVIKGIHKSASAEHNSENIRWAAEFVGQHYETFPEQEWFPYYYGQLLVQTGDLENARELILPLVRKKRSESWAWRTLGETFPDGEEDKRLACLCRAALCKTQNEGFVWRRHFFLGKLLLSMGHIPEAKYETAKAIAIRKAEGWSVPGDLAEMEAAQWYQEAEPPQNNSALYRKHAPLADEIIYTDLPDLDAVVVHQLERRDDRPGRTFIGYLDGNTFREIGVKTKQFDCLKQAEVGVAVSLRIDSSGNHPFVVSVKKRAAESWDIIEPQIGVVKHINRDKGVTSVALGRDAFCLFHHDRFPAIRSVELGTVVAVKTRHDAKRDILRALSFAATDQDPPASFCKQFAGRLSVNDGGRFGFVDHDIYVPGELIDPNGLTDNDLIKGLALMDFNKRRNQYGWRAVKAARDE